MTRVDGCPKMTPVFTDCIYGPWTWVVCTEL